MGVDAAAATRCAWNATPRNMGIRFLAPPRGQQLSPPDWVVRACWYPLRCKGRVTAEQTNNNRIREHQAAVERRFLLRRQSD